MQPINRRSNSSGSENAGGSFPPPPNRSSRRRGELPPLPDSSTSASADVFHIVRAASSHAPSWAAVSVSAAGVGSSGAIVGSSDSNDLLIWAISLFFVACFTGYNIMFPNRAEMKSRIWRMCQFIGMVSEDSSPPGSRPSPNVSTSTSHTDSVPSVSASVSRTDSTSQNNANASRSCCTRYTSFLRENGVMLLAWLATFYMIIITSLILARVLPGESRLNNEITASNNTTVSPFNTTVTAAETSRPANRVLEVFSLALDITTPEIVLMLVACVQWLIFLVHFVRRVASCCKESSETNAAITVSETLETVSESPQANVPQSSSSSEAEEEDEVVVIVDSQHTVVRFYRPDAS